MNPEIKKAEADYRHAAKTLMLTVAEHYPVGSIVAVESNTAYGKSVHDIKITDHGHWYCAPTHLIGVNIHTSKRRKFSVHDIVWKITAVKEGS